MLYVIFTAQPSSSGSTETDAWLGIIPVWWG